MTKDKLILTDKRTQDDFEHSSSEESIWIVTAEKVHFKELEKFLHCSLHYVLDQEKEYLAYGVDHALNYYKEQFQFNSSTTTEELDMCIAGLKRKPNLLDNIIYSWCVFNVWSNIIIVNETKDQYELICWQTTA